MRPNLPIRQWVTPSNTAGTETATLAAPLRTQGVGTQDVQIVDGGGNPVGVTAGALNVTGAIDIGAALSLSVIVSAGNSSTTNLSATSSPTPYTFIGTGVSTLGVNSIQVSLFADKNCTLQVQQSQTDPPSAHWDLVDTYVYYANSNFGVTVQTIAASVRVVVSTASLTTGTFRLQTVLCPIADPLPRSLDTYGNLAVGVKSSHDLYGFEAENTPMGEIRAVLPHRLVGAQFEGVGNSGAVDPNFWNSTVANSGTVTQGNGHVVLNTTTTAANGTARLCSVRRGRYVSSNAMRYRAIIQLSAAAADNTRRWGIGWGSSMPATITVTDGAWFQMAGTTFGIAYQQASTNGGAAQVVTTFNGILGATYTPGTPAIAYEIYWTNRSVYWVIGGQVLHSIDFTGGPWADTVSFHVFADNTNSNALQTANTLNVRVACITRLGAALTQPTSYYRATTTTGVVLKYGLGNLHSLLIGSVAASGSVISLYDGLTSAGTLMAQWTITYPGGGNFIPQSYDLKGIPFFTGITLVVATQAASVTVIYE